MQYCRDRMKKNVEHRCDQHPDPYDCPDNLVIYSPKFDEFGLIIHDGGHSHIEIQFCPWCGAGLPKSKRDRWFDELEAMGIDPGEDDIPPHYRSNAWYRVEDA